MTGHRPIDRPRPARRRLLLATALASACAIAPLVADEIRIMPLARGGHLLVTFTLGGGFTDQVRASIQSGLPTTFRYEVELRRGTPFWFDRTFAETVVSAAVRFDNLTRRHQLTLSVDGRLEDSRVTEQEAEVVRWMTAFERLPLFNTSDLEPNGEYYVRVRLRKHPRVAWFFWPWDRGSASGHAKFTFIP